MILLENNLYPFHSKSLLFATRQSKLNKKYVKNFKTEELPMHSGEAWYTEAVV